MKPISTWCGVVTLTAAASAVRAASLQTQQERFEQRSTVPTSGGQPAADDILIFGDSYSDNCNYLRLFNETAGQQYPFPNCPPPPEGRASGGKAWSEYLDRIPRVHNYAFSGATCSNAATNRSPIPDVGNQIHLVRTKFNTTGPVSSLAQLYDPKTTIAVVYIGGNDMSYFLQDLTEVDPSVRDGNDQRNRSNNFLEISDCVIGRFDELHGRGLKRFVYMDEPAFQETPLFNTSAGVHSFLETMVLAENQLVKYKLKELFAKWNDDSTLEIFPTYDYFQAYLAHPKEYGFTTPYEINAETGFWANNLHASDHSNKILASKFQRFYFDGARGNNLINGTT